MISVNGVSMRFGSKVLFEDVTTTFSRGPPLRPDRAERRRQVDVHEAADRRAAAAEGHRRRGPTKLGVLRQDQFAFDALPRHRHRDHGQRAAVERARGARARSTPRPT